jgi:hypothetical protein
MSEKNLNATTNLKGGKKSWDQVSFERLTSGFVLQLSNRFLVFLDSFTSNNAGVLLEAPRCRLEDCCCQVVGRVGEVAQQVDGHRKELHKKVSRGLLSCI